MQAEGEVGELLWLDGSSSARIRCPPGLVPLPGQYVLAYEPDSGAVLASALFGCGAAPGGFLAASPIPSTWRPGTRLYLRGPLGHGFGLPPLARRVALVAFHCSSRILVSLLGPALGQDASVVWVSDSIPADLPLQVEAQPLHALLEVCQWADYVAFDLERGELPELKSVLQGQRTTMKAEAQLLVRAPMPCGALAACGVCAVEAGASSLLACEDGPVFGFRQLMRR